MDLKLTDDQQMIRDSAARFVSDKGRRDPGEVGFDRTLWAEIAEMGFLAAGMPADLGGLGGPIETALVVEELGRGMRAGDFLGAGVLGPQLLVASGDATHIAAHLEQVITGDRLVAAAFSEAGADGDLARVATRAVKSGADYQLSGVKTLVLSGSEADLLIVSGRTEGSESERSGISLFLVDPRGDGVTIQATPLLDGSSAATIKFEQSAGVLLGKEDAGYEALCSMAEHGIAAIAAEAVGMIEAVADITAEYFRSRKQFGMLLGQFQVLQHKLADMTIDAEMSRATLLVSLASFETDDPSLRALRFSGAKASTCEALRRVTEAGVQAHGGMGMTQEYPVGRYLQRMAVLDAVLGTPAGHLSRCARSPALTRP